RRRRDQDDVDVRGQRAQVIRRIGGRDVASDAALVRLEVEEAEGAVLTGLVVDEGRDPAAPYALRRLDLHDVGAEVRQKTTAIGADRPGQVEHADAVEGKLVAVHFTSRSFISHPG